MWNRQSEPLPNYVDRMTMDISDIKQHRERVFALFRKYDESHLWPIKGKFNATNKAIHRVRKYEKSCGTVLGLELCLMIDEQISQIVNGVI